jgi:hypothetical protein
MVDIHEEQGRVVETRIGFSWHDYYCKKDEILWLQMCSSGIVAVLVSAVKMDL